MNDTVQRHDDFHRIRLIAEARFEGEVFVIHLEAPHRFVVDVENDHPVLHVFRRHPAGAVDFHPDVGAEIMFGAVFPNGVNHDRPKILVAAHGGILDTLKGNPHELRVQKNGVSACASPQGDAQLKPYLRIVRSWAVIESMKDWRAKRRWA